MDDIILFYFHRDQTQYLVDVIYDNDLQEYVYDAESIKKLLQKLREYTDQDKDCFAYLHTWNQIVDFDKNERVLIAFNNKKFIVQAWCIFCYEKYENDIYALQIKQINTRYIPKIKGIGTYMINFIKDKCLKNISYIDNDKIVDIDVNILYLYSLIIAVEFYRKLTFLKEEMHEKKRKLGSTFYHIAKHTDKLDLEAFKNMWKENFDAYMDCDAMREYQQDTYNIKHKFATKCQADKPEISFIETRIP